MIKVVHITSNISGGAGIAALRLHRSLLQQNDVDSYLIQTADTDEKLSAEKVCTLYESKNIFYRLRRKLGLTPEKRHNKLIATYPRHHEYEIATFPTTSYKIENHPLVKETDIIHLHWVASFLNYPSFFKTIKKPVVWTLHDKNPFHGLFHTETDERNNATRYGKLDKKIALSKVKYLQQANDLHIVTPSIWLLNKSRQSDTLGRFPHLCIANSIDLDLCSVSHKDAQKRLGIDNGRKTLLFIAHAIDIPRRGFYIMKDAFKGLESKLPDFNLLTVGGNKVELDIPSINHIHFNTTDERELLNTIYAAADIQILSTQEDNLPNVMLESFANGTPVISFANGGMVEHIITGENGILVDEIGVEPLKLAIEDFLADKYIFDREEIQKYAKEHFDQRKQAEKYIELYRKILNK